ncbi:MAG: V-type ATP synthase subunit I [Planctomycetota bacterium]
MRRIHRSAAGFEADAKKLDYILTHFERFAPRPRSLAENFVSVPLLVSRQQVQELLDSFRFQEMYSQVHKLSEQYLLREKKEADLRAELALLQPMADAEFKPGDLSNLKYTTIHVGIAPLEQWKRLETDPRTREVMAWEATPVSSGRVRLIVAHLHARSEDALELLKSADFAGIALPALDKTPGERIAEIGEAMEGIHREKENISHAIASLAQNREKVQIIYAHYLSETQKAEASGRLLGSPRIAVMSGYVRAKDAEGLSAAVTKEFPSVSLILEDPTPTDNVPVSISLNRFLKPVQLLVNMFGLPNYFGFDPTPYIAITFLVFFGICFGDVLYGLLLLAISAFLMHKAGRHAGLKNFCALFVYAGISTMIFGALTGSWASDLADPKYLGEGNFLLKLRNIFYVFDPLANTIYALLIALGIGICNQFYGIILLMYRCIRQGRIADAIFDGGSWLILLPGFIITAARLFVAVPNGLATMGVVLFAVGAIMLIVTQGRNEQTFAAKAITGLVSLYGILGSYGCTSFLGDVLSYSRLLALGLTTSIVGMAFNIIAGLLGDISCVGGVLFVLMVIFGHTFNFAMSILGAFVHPARLIFLEFFSRFYEGGAISFKPFGFGTTEVSLMDS